MKKLNKQEQIDTMATKLEYRNNTIFFHCEHCLKKFLASPKYLEGKTSPQEWGEYEIAANTFTYPNKEKTKAGILTVWCKKCGQSVWDSRHLTNLF